MDPPCPIQPQAESLEPGSWPDWLKVPSGGERGNRAIRTADSVLLGLGPTDGRPQRFVAAGLFDMGCRVFDRYWLCQTLGHAGSPTVEASHWILDVANVETRTSRP